MPFTVFYAWQMDTEKKRNRWFIDNAIKAAIKAIRAEYKEQQDLLQMEVPPGLDPHEDLEANPDADPIIDRELVMQWGAAGGVGAPLIGEAILSRIASSGVFIADVTIVTDFQTADKRSKKTPNANVLIEIGAASQTGGRWDRVVLVMNTAYGSPEDLPFDLKLRHCTVQYEFSDTTDSAMKSSRQKSLAKDLADQIRPLYKDYLFACYQTESSISPNKYFKGSVGQDLNSALDLANVHNRPVFMVVYDPSMSGNSHMDHGLGYMLELEETKTKIKENFVQVVVDRGKPGVERYLCNVNLQHCYIVVIAPNGTTLYTGQVYANSEVGGRIVDEILQAWENSRS